MAIIIDGNGKGTVTGTASDDEIYGGNGKDILDGGAGNDELFGGNGDDTLIGGAGDDTLYGDNGKDTAVYSGPMSNYLFELQSDGAIRVFDTTGADGSDLVYDVSYFKFANTTVKLADLPLSQIQTTADYSWTTHGRHCRSRDQYRDRAGNNRHRYPAQQHRQRYRWLGQ